MRVAELRGAKFPEARIVVVDDQEINVHVLSRLLRKVGYEHVRGITDPRDLFERGLVDACDILLLDIHMPHLDGIEVTRRVRGGTSNADEHFPILILTADVSDEVKLNALEVGADDFLTKPFDVNEVVLRVQNLLAMHFAYEQLRSYSGDLEVEVHDRTKRLQAALKSADESREQALWIVGLTLEYRDAETKGHTDRVTRLALEVGRLLGLSSQDLRDLRWGSYLHDTGKIAVPDRVLLKPGKLTEEEYGLMKQHVLIGEEMLRKADFLPPSVLDVVRHHHERWDGSGYPDRLREKEIPVLARIFSVVDVYDALTSKRPYKQAWTRGAALEEIAKQQGVQFDPAVVQAFLQLPDPGRFRD